MKFKQYLNEQDFDPLAILMGKSKEHNKQKADFQKIRKGIISDLTKYFIKYKNELERLDKKKYKENLKKVTIGGTKDDFQSFDMSIGTINQKRKERKLKELLDMLKEISAVETKLKKAIDIEDIAKALEFLVDSPYADLSNYAEKQWKKYK